MTKEGHKVASLHGAKEAFERDTIIDRFRNGQEKVYVLALLVLFGADSCMKVLITTNVIARGIDIPQVNMVVNYDLPLLSDRGQQQHDETPDLETYIHRIGALLFSSLF